MARRIMTVFGRQFLALCICVICHVAQSQNGSQVLPPDGASNATYTSNVGSNDTTTESTTAAKVTASSRPDCSLVAVYPVQDELNDYLISGAKLVEMDLALENYRPDFLPSKLKHVYQPAHWVRSTGRQGRSLLVLEDNYDFMSLFFLSIGVFKMNVTLADSPRNCLMTRSPQEILQLMKRLLLNDFKPQEEGQASGSLSVDEHVCYITINDDDGYAEFRYRCCHVSPDGDIICHDVTTDGWLDVLMAFIVITKVLVVLFSPSFLPGSLYRLKYVALEYLYRIPDASPVKRIKVVVTQFPGSYGNDAKVVKMSEVKGMEYFKTMVDTNMQLDKIYNVTIDRIHLSVKARRLLGENFVPVGLLRVLYNNLLRCRIRRLAPLKECCDTNVLGRLNPGLKCPKWFTVCRTLARLILLAILVLPWVIRIWVFYAYEDDTVEKKMKAADTLGLKTSFRGSLTLYLTPVHDLFVFVYVILIIDSLLYGVLSQSMKEKFKMVLRKCLQDMRERSRISVCAWITCLLVMPFRIFGVVGILLFLPYLLIVLPMAVPVAAFYLFPALNLTVRLIIHFFLFMCPAKVTDNRGRFSACCHKVREQLDLNKVTAEETFARGTRLTKNDVILQMVVIFMVLISFWSLTFLLMEVVSFLVEVAIYTLMGIIVNAGSLLRYVTVIVLVLIYGRSAFNDVHKTYLAYHKKIHSILLEMTREKVNVIARQEALDQENTALHVQGDMADPAEDPHVRLVVKEGQPLWRTSSVLMFLDRHDTPYTPEKFFYDVITLNYCGAPGPLYKHFLDAFWTFARILLFLFFVFVVVMAFGDAYSVSSTNQLLATVAGGFIPFLFRYIFSAAGGVPSLYTDSVQFQTQFHQAINNYTQNWPVYDIIPTKFGDTRLQDSLVMNRTTVSDESSQHSNQTHNNPDLSHVDGEGGKGVGDVSLQMEGVDIDEGGVDMIVDVSTAESRRVGPLCMREAGSASMLAADSVNRSARINRPQPPQPQERAIDV